jgi:membrane peptidoglycan carboxypeptidase
MDTSFVAYTSRFVTAAWLGDDKYVRELGKLDAAYMTVVPLWARYMFAVASDYPNLEIPWEVPPGVEPKDRGEHSRGPTGRRHEPHLPATPRSRPRTRPRPTASRRRDARRRQVAAATGVRPTAGSCGHRRRGACRPTGAGRTAMLRWRRRAARPRHRPDARRRDRRPLPALAPDRQGRHGAGLRGRSPGHRQSGSRSRSSSRSTTRTTRSSPASSARPGPPARSATSTSSRSSTPGSPTTGAATW